MNYIEKFDITFNGISIRAAISLEGEDSIFGRAGYKPWVGGCGISPAFKTLPEAREYLFNYIRGDIQGRINLYSKTVIDLQKLSSELGDDVFNLAQFKIGKND